VKPVQSLKAAKLQNRIRAELIEADVESAFELLDSARAATMRGDAALASRTIDSVDAVLADIDARIARLEGIESAPFGPLIGELRRELDSIRRAQAEA
jgi:hypothetical protein